MGLVLDILDLMYLHKVQKKKTKQENHLRMDQEISLLGLYTGDS